MTKKIKDPGWNFDNSYTKLPDSFFKSTNPTPVNSPQLVILNGTLAKSLGLNVQALQGEEGIDVFAGNKIPEGGSPLAQAYAGHQFGHFTMLGDGRAVLIGEQITPENERVDIQLKGPGRTPFSRGGDGRAGLGPMLREYIISEAMHALGIPTTRSLAVVTTGEPVYREIVLPGAILTRVAASHIRVGTFQYAARFGTVEDLRALADYTISRHYPDIKDDENKYLSFLKEVIKRQAALIARWQLVGFIHGVMNTDNMTISGETIDYGPCAFMDEYSPATVFSSIDREGRYAYGNQPYIAVWNLARLAESLLALINENQDEAVRLAEEALSGYGALFEGRWLEGMRAKLGIFNEEEQDESLVKELLQLMEKHRADFTNTFLALTFDTQKDTALFVDPEFTQWHEKWQSRLGNQQESNELSHELMRKSNPSVIPRNHRVEEALEAAVEQGDFSVLYKLLQVISKPYAHSPEQEEYCTLPAPSGRPYQTFCGT
ncbi:protein adenylyltransferase SelO [Neobacillus drentensis]|uniref:protein adenylyltransferase SelO n=1 Tax=Neobacillus drentensis TaxID=220684 RepID=UPI0030007197